MKDFEWILIPQASDFHIGSSYYPIHVGNHKLIINKQPERPFYSFEKDNSKLFLWGFPNFANIKSGPDDLINNYLEEGFKVFERIKGAWLGILIDGDAIQIFNDKLGLYKFFYADLNEGIIASSDFWMISSLVPDGNVSKKNILTYLVKHYFIEDQTILEEVKKSLPASKLFLKNDLKEISQYFSIDKLLKEATIENSNKDVIESALLLWKRLIKENIEGVNPDKLFLTLTGGLDSRLVLAGFKSQGVSPNTFTFGSSKSMDVMEAVRISEQLKLNHYPFDLRNDLKENFSNLAKENIKNGMSLISISRTFRNEAYKSLKGHASKLFFGFIGSEVLRGGVFPDGLMYSGLATDYWSKQYSAERNYLNYDFIENNNESKIVIEGLISKKWMQNPDSYIFNHIVPNHFAQDINLINNIGIEGVCLFWDDDFVKFISKTSYFVDNSKKETLSTNGHLKRIQGPGFTCNLISKLDYDCAKLKLGKGYSPMDFHRSKYIAGLKYVFHKTLNVNSKPQMVLTYGAWYKNYLLDLFSNSNVEELGIKKPELLNSLKIHTGQTEKSYLIYTLIANLLLINEEIKNCRS
ncbi:MAG: hypothetical protein H0X62_00165 [Bacteroidetes bacterium]|nr:hypothetical protein [Bacteroidota bacterium]